MSEEIIKECLIVLKKKNLEVSGLKEIPPRILKSTVNSCQLNSKTFFLNIFQRPDLTYRLSFKELAI